MLTFAGPDVKSAAQPRCVLPNNEKTGRAMTGRGRELNLLSAVRGWWCDFYIIKSGFFFFARGIYCVFLYPLSLLCLHSLFGHFFILARGLKSIAREEVCFFPPPLAERNVQKKVGAVLLWRGCTTIVYVAQIR